MFFKCHNCGTGQSLANFIKFIDFKLYEEYLLERYKQPAPSIFSKFTDFKPKFKETNILEKYKKISELDDKHPAKKYLQDRKIPVIHYDKFYLVDKFYELVKKVKKDIVIKNDHPRTLLFLFMIQLVSYLHFKA